MSFIVDYFNESKRQNIRGRCLHFSDGNRCNEIISAHSIQKKRQLSLIAEEGHVYRINSDLSILKITNGVPQLKKIGINKVSTFFGFCKQHDNSIFELIDNSFLAPNKQQVALYAYRCLCREYFVKENAVNVLTKMRNHSTLNSSQKNFLTLAKLGNSAGFDGLKYHKEHYEEALSNGNYEQFEFVCFTSSSPCNSQFSGLLYPDHDFEGNFLQDLTNHEHPMDLITFFTAPTSDGWAFVFGWHATSNQTCIPFIQSLANRVSMGEKLEDALLRFSLSCCENHALRISWWERLNEHYKHEAMERLLLMANPIVETPSNYLVFGCENIADWTYKSVYTTLQRSV